MSTPSERLILEYKDISGGFMRTSNWLNPASSPGALEAAIQGATNANLAFTTYNFPDVGVVTPSNTLYASVFDGLLFTFGTTPGGALQFFLPAPLGTMFQPGGIQINPASPAYIALNAALIASLTDVSGNTVSGIISAVKTSRRSDQVN